MWKKILLTWASTNLELDTSKRKDKRKWWRDAPPWVCLKARNGIRYTFYFVPFSNFGTYSAHTVWKIGGGGPKFFSFLNWVEDNWPHTDESEAAGTLSKEKKDCTCFHTCIWWRTYKSWAGEDHLHTHNLSIGWLCRFSGESTGSSSFSCNYFKAIQIQY